MYSILCVALIFGLINGDPLETRSHSIYPSNQNNNAGYSDVGGYREIQHNPNPNNGEQYQDQYNGDAGGQQGPTANKYPNQFYQDPNYNVKNNPNPGRQNAATHNMGGQAGGERNNNPINGQYGAEDPSGYSLVNIGNGVNRKNNVVINKGNDYDEVFVETGNKKNTNYHQTQGTDKGFNNNNKPGQQQPCNQYGPSFSQKNCPPQSGTGYDGDGYDDGTYHPPPSNYNIGNGRGNENVVTINTGRHRPSANGRKPNKNIEIVSIYDDDSGISYNDDKTASHYSIGRGQNNKNSFLSIFGLS